jgi:hypothetical protein
MLEELAREAGSKRPDLALRLRAGAFHQNSDVEQQESQLCSSSRLKKDARPLALACQQAQKDLKRVIYKNFGEGTLTLDKPATIGKERIVADMQKVTGLIPCFTGDRCEYVPLLLLIFSIACLYYLPDKLLLSGGLILARTWGNSPEIVR